MSTGSLTRASLALLLLASCKRSGEADASAGDAAQPTISAQVVTVRAQPFTETVGAIGVVAPRAGHTAALGAPAQARIARVLVSAGQHIAAGQPLVELDQAPFEAAARSAESAVGAAQASYSRTARLASEGIAPRKDVETAAADLARARAELVTARRNAQLAVLRSPISGVVTRMSAALGATVDPAQPLVEIADQSALDILLSTTPTDAARMRPGARVTLSAGQSASGEPLGIGTVVDISGTVDTSSRSVSVRAQAPTTRRRLRIGETVFGQIAVGTNPSALVVPNAALVPSGEGFQLFVVDAKGIAHARPVTVGGRTDSLAEITTGLAAGERVAAEGAYGVQDSAKVVPLERVSGAESAGSKTVAETSSAPVKP